MVLTQRNDKLNVLSYRTFSEISANKLKTRNSIIGTDSNSVFRRVKKDPSGTDRISWYVMRLPLIKQMWKGIRLCNIERKNLSCTETERINLHIESWYALQKWLVWTLCYVQENLASNLTIIWSDAKCTLNSEFEKSHSCNRIIVKNVWESAKNWN